MKNYTATATALKNASAIKAVPEAIVDWNMNRYLTATAENTPLEIDSAYDAEFFPIESIIEPIRPNKGINKARVGQGVVSEDYLPLPTGMPNPRYYIADVDDTYKYWTSQTPSDASTAALANCKPQVTYSTAVAVNKIQIKLENTWASPTTFNIQTSTVLNPTDAQWTTVATQATTPAGWTGTGIINLYWNGTNWTNATRSDNADKSPKTTTITGVRMVVTALGGGFMVDATGTTVATQYYKYVGGTRTLTTTDGKDAFFDLIEMGLHLEVDLSPNVVEMSTTLDLGNASNLFPIGTNSTNQGTLTLNNLYYNGSSWVPGLFSADNTSSPYYQYIDENARMTGSWNYYNADTGAFIEKVQEFVMYVDNWNGQEDDEVEVDMSDHSKFFDVDLVAPALWQDLTVPQIVWRLLDSVGFNNYFIEQNDLLITEHKIPVFYTDGTKTVWEILGELSEASQTAIYFDSFGVLQVKTREFALSSTDASVWTFTSVPAGGQLANIISLDATTVFEPNNYSVVYQQTNFAPDNNGQPTLQTVWSQDGPVVLRATPLVRQLLTSDTKMYMGSDDVRLWPYKGLVNVQGELIRYEGKEYVYYTGATGATRNVEVIKNQDDYKSRNQNTPWAYRHKNYFTGALIITTRGEWNSEAKNHYVDANGYTVSRYMNGTRNTNVPGFRYLRQNSAVELTNVKNFKDYKDILAVTHGATTDSPFYYYGTKFKFNKGRSQNTVGMILHDQNNSTQDGYYIEFTPHYRMDSKMLKSRKGEAILYTRSGGKDYQLDFGRFTFIENRFYEVDVTYRNIGGDHQIKVWVNGKLILSKLITSNKNTPNGRFGMMIRGKSKATYEYLYAIAKLDADPPDDFSFMDKVQRGYTGNQWDREFVYRHKTKTRRVKKPTHVSYKRIDQMFFDEFGPYVHEIREFDVKFDPAPVQMSRIINTNDWSSIILEYRSDPFGAHFLVANTARQNVVLNGDDSTSFGADATVNQVLSIIGQGLVVKDGANVTAKNDTQIKRRGKIDAELSSDWIQSKQMAQDVADWMNNHFSYGNDTITLTVFGNPLIELGDVVHVSYPLKNINSDYFVLGVQNGFDAGVTTTLTLRRRVA